LRHCSCAHIIAPVFHALICVSPPFSFLFFFDATATTEIYTLSLHDALPISIAGASRAARIRAASGLSGNSAACPTATITSTSIRSEEHTSELQSRGHLVCRLLLEKKKKQKGHLYAFKLRTAVDHWHETPP